jgi:hypothetical protein
MYTLFLAGLIGLGLGSAGCVGGSSDHGSGSFDATWTFLASGNVPTTCIGAGITEVDLDVQGVHSGASYTDTFVCSDYGGTGAPLPVDDYTVALRAYESSGATVPVSTFDFSGLAYSIYAGEVTSLPIATFLLQH